VVKRSGTNWTSGFRCKVLDAVDELFKYRSNVAVGSDGLFDVGAEAEESVCATVTSDLGVGESEDVGDCVASGFIADEDGSRLAWESFTGESADARSS